MPDTNLPGSAVADASVSSRVYVTEPAAAFAFFEMKTRPVVVATHIVPVSLAARSIAATNPPTRVVPRESAADTVKLVAAVGPIWTKSPHPALVPGVVNSGQLASRYAWLPPQSWVRQTLCEPSKIEPAAAGLGSAMIGA